MVVCKFFQQGACRFGQNCKFEHIYGSKYNYHASSTQNHPQAQSLGVTDEQLVNQVQSDMQAALKGGQWILSSYAPFKEKPVFPGIADLSPEEARLFIYEAKAQNMEHAAIEHMNNMVNGNRNKYEQLLQPTPALIKALRSIYKGEMIPTPFGNTPQTSSTSSGFGNPNPSSIFRSAAQNTSVFGQQQATSNTGMFASANVFGQPQDNSAAKSIFAQASQNSFSQGPPNMFGSNENTAAKSIFSQASQNIFAGSQTAPTQNVFGNQNQSVFGNQNQSVFGNDSNAFAQNPSPNQNQSVFGNESNSFAQNPSPFTSQAQSEPFKQNASPFTQNASPFTQNVFQDQKPSFGNVFQQPTADDPGVYSKMEDVSKEDMDAFNGEDFKLGFIPEVPPPRGLCF